MKEKLNVQMITDYMKNNGLTKKEFCKQCQISTSTLYRIMHGENFNFKIISLFKIAKKINLKLCQFFIRT